MNERAPLRARLHWYRLTAMEFALLTAMCEHCSDGSVVWAAIPRLAAYSKLSDRKVQRLIRSFCSRGILSQLAGWGKDSKARRPATYRINEAALEDDPRMGPYRSPQPQLPGIRCISIPGEPITDADLVSTVHQSGDPRTPDLVSRGHQTGVPRTPDSRSYDSTPLDPKPKTQHGDAALNSMPAWIAFKEELRAELSATEWDLWVRPMFLLRTLPAAPGKKHLLAALPPNGRIQAAALKRQEMMRELLAPIGMNISLTRYPDEWEAEQAKERFGLDIAPKPWTRA